MHRRQILRMTLLAACAACVTAGHAGAAPVSFDAGWKEQKFRLFSSNTYKARGARLDVISDGTVSMLWRPVDRADWSARRASWRWNVTRSVPATDLTRKGGDDRNLALYFVFLPQAEAERLAGSGSIRSLLQNPEARVLVYVWGGAHRRGQILPSPYLDRRGKTVILRSSGTGSHAESVDLAADHARAFGTPPGALVGLAVSADSDDTASAIRATIEQLELD
ncbi:Protein of unknown function (DUF3047) [Albidovulum inexpectatum]|uniref:DUF3047 family protein n=1 Tax=Albidovulum inexpectatum TaxID=196587 RepID=A0A2S5JHJ1_9RHOB|nr:DUF3047 domain-containing protein [Albidovulum inexpectatum]PPB80922.1 Protein of unknown function (DUF3047) [Albidovulum inexpectatum]